jgi:hypothetical protein
MRHCDLACCLAYTDQSLTAGLLCETLDAGDPAKDYVNISRIDWIDHHQTPAWLAIPELCQRLPCDVENASRA